MKSMPRKVVSAVVGMCLVSSTFAIAAPTERETLDAMRRAASFMVDEVSCNGGYLRQYTADLSEGWGEDPARKSQIWVQNATPDMGECYLDIYEATGDTYYLECAKKAANALIWGQHPLGGWHYFIDFDMPGIEEYYATLFSPHEEYAHFYGNCTYDDNTTQSVTMFLMRLYMTTLDPGYREPLIKALDFFLISQYPNGAWPQRYPLRYDYAHDSFPDYTSFYTFNDSVHWNNVLVLLSAYEQLGNEEYLTAAKRGMDFVILSQGPPEQAAWSQQVGMDMKPANGRTFEPAAYRTRVVTSNIKWLQTYYAITGDRRYLTPIPNAIKWLEKSVIERLENGEYWLARYYEQDTNRPIFERRITDLNDEGFFVTVLEENPIGDDNKDFRTIDIAGITAEFVRFSALTPEEAHAEYLADNNTVRTPDRIDPATVDGLISSMDDRGAWLTDDVSVHFRNKTARHQSRRILIRGITVGTFIDNMHTFLDYLETDRAH
jgi:PelA/Pel-15E family pectate lyase